MIATNDTAGYVRCGHCGEVFDVEPGDKILCPTQGCPGGEE